MVNDLKNGTTGMIFDGPWETSNNLSMSGVPFIGMDLGGFWNDSDGELLVRFAQLGALMPFCRNHNAKFTHAQEPWAFGGRAYTHPQDESRPGKTQWNV